jgi:hypothetical protein
LKGTLRGELIEPGDSGYDEARKVYNGMISKRPRAIAKCADVADVIACVQAGADRGLPVAIRGRRAQRGRARHLRRRARHRPVTDEPRWTWTPRRTRCAWAAGRSGSTSTRRRTNSGRPCPRGSSRRPGVGGLSLGGGIGHITRKCGLTIDNILGAQMVLADGETTTVDAQHNPICTGRSAAAAATSASSPSSPSARTTSTPTTRDPCCGPLDRAKEIMQWYREFLPAQPDELNGFFAFLVVPPGPPFPEALHLKPMCGIVWCYTGPADQVDKVFAPIRKLGPSLDLVGPIPHPVLQSMFDALYVPGLQWYWKADFVKELSDEAIDRHVEHGSKMPSMFSTMHLYPVDGAASRVGKSETPWAYRDAKWSEVIVGVDPDPRKKDDLIHWARSYWEATHPYSAGGAYVNFMMEEEGEERVKATYGDNFARLAMVKARYDKGNLFRVNQNIKPASTPV